MATYTKLDSGNWRAQIRKGGVSKSMTFGKKAEAVAWAKATESTIRSGAATGLLTPPKGMTFAMAARAYLDAVPIHRTAATSLRASLAHFGDVPLADFNGFSLQAWVAQRRADGIAGSTIARNISTISGVLKWARHARSLDVDLYAARDALRGLTAARVPTTAQQRDRIPTTAELTRLREYFKSLPRAVLPLADLMDFACESALRLGEITAIRWDDMQGASVLVRDRKDPKRKLGNHQRVPLSQAALAIIERQPKTSERIFPVLSATVSQKWVMHTKKLGINNLTFHDLRHYCITNLFKKGLTIQQVALISGHKTWSQLARYTQLTHVDVVDLLG